VGQFAHGAGIGLVAVPFALLLLFTGAASTLRLGEG
jgi:hypothetical protein